MTKRVAIYTRVSTLDQAREGYSLSAQRKALTRWAKEHGYEIIGYYAAERASQGKRTCNEVLGYDLDGKDNFKINPNEAERVRYIFTKYTEHHSLSAVAELCRLRGYTGKRGRPQTAESIRKILTRPIYAGFNAFHGALYKGQHRPIVSVREYNHVQRLLQKHSHKHLKYPKLPE